MLSQQVDKLALVCHPLSPCGARCSVEALVQRSAGGLNVAYLVRGDTGALRIPAPAVPQRADELWRHTCCELFVARPGEPGYREFNFSPSGEWAAYEFSAYRQRIGNPDVRPDMRATRSPGEVTIEVTLPLFGRLQIGVTAVIEEANGTLSYWALRHPPGKPDFHHPDALALELDEARA
jgi:hypothetical protein